VGVASLGVIAGIVWFCLRRRRAQKQSGSYIAPPDTHSYGGDSTQKSDIQGPGSSAYSERNYLPELSNADPNEQQPAELGGRQIAAELPGHMSPR
jgi:hypothetical protein